MLGRYLRDLCMSLILLHRLLSMFSYLSLCPVWKIRFYTNSLHYIAEHFFGDLKISELERESFLKVFLVQVQKTDFMADKTFLLHIIPFCCSLFYSLRKSTSSKVLLQDNFQDIVKQGWKILHLLYSHNELPFGCRCQPILLTLEQLCLSIHFVEPTNFSSFTKIIISLPTFTRILSWFWIALSNLSNLA